LVLLPTSLPSAFLHRVMHLQRVNRLKVCFVQPSLTRTQDLEWKFREENGVSPWRAVAQSHSRFL